MAKHGWLVWLTPLACWAIYMCWLTGYQSGYQVGHVDGWDTAHRVSLPEGTRWPVSPVAQRNPSLLSDLDDQYQTQ
jgi:hypothetical protein